jgi:hypothetical protein
MPQPHSFRTFSELQLLRTLNDRSDGSPPSQVEIETVLESGLARLMLLQGRLRQQTSRAGGGRSGEGAREDELVEKIRSLRDAISKLRARMDPEGSAPLAEGFVVRRNL